MKGLRREFKEGDFESLSGKGQPISSGKNPYEDCLLGLESFKDFAFSSPFWDLLLYKRSHPSHRPS